MMIASRVAVIRESTFEGGTTIAFRTFSSVAKSLSPLNSRSPVTIS